MFQIVKFIQGATIIVLTGLREFESALAKAAELSRLEAVVYAVRRMDNPTRMIAYAVRGERTPHAYRVLELISDPGLPDALRLEPPVSDSGDLDDEPDPVHVA